MQQLNAMQRVRLVLVRSTLCSFGGFLGSLEEPGFPQLVEGPVRNIMRVLGRMENLRHMEVVWHDPWQNPHFQHRWDYFAAQLKQLVVDMLEKSGNSGVGVFVMGENESVGERWGCQSAGGTDVGRQDGAHH
jgi:hypothetical protein